MDPQVCVLLIQVQAKVLVTMKANKWAAASGVASGVSVDDVLSSWAGGESVAASAPKEEAAVEEAPKEEAVVEVTVEEEAPVDEAPKEEAVVATAVTNK